MPRNIPDAAGTPHPGAHFVFACSYLLLIMLLFDPLPLMPLLDPLPLTPPLPLVPLPVVSDGAMTSATCRFFGSMSRISLLSCSLAYS